MTANSIWRDGEGWERSVWKEGVTRAKARHRRVEMYAETAHPVGGQVQKTRRPSLGRQVRVILWSTLNAKLSSDCF